MKAPHKPISGSIADPVSFPLDSLAGSLEGELFQDMSWRLMYATDASVYREIPLAVCFPKHAEDLQKIVQFCHEQNIHLIPRTAGTSLAGQVVGNGLIVDISRHMSRILELNVEERWVKVEPGVILDELNDYLKPYGLFFGPETSTSNRCMIGGMVGNNACGAHSLIYGSTRDHTLEIEAILSDGSSANFGPLSREAFREKCVGSRLENRLYNHLFSTLSDAELRREIEQQYPDKRIHRRNTGYALDILLEADVFSNNGDPFNFCKLLAGSEGTLALFSSIKLNLVSLPPPEKGLVCIHTHSLEEALQANLVALQYKPVAVELIDRWVLECTRANISQNKNRFFVEGDPAAILVVEFAESSREIIVEKTAAMESELRKLSLGYHYPLITGKQISRVWNLRKAGLGVLSNMPGDAKPVAVIEDAAVHTEVLPSFIKDLQIILDHLNIECVYYAHVGSGEIHIRPVLNLKNPADVEKFYEIARETAFLVKKHRGSLSGEHGDGRLRSEFIPIVLGEKIPQLFSQIKRTWDPKGIFNPGKITDPLPMKSRLRYTPGLPQRKLTTYFDYPDAGSFLQAVEKCNGSGDCRKPHSRGGVMCPSYHASLTENTTTRARANLLREYLTHSPKKNPFDQPELLEVLDLCLSCKACKSECPSNVDMARYKAEFLQQYYLSERLPLRARMIGAYDQFNKWGAIFPPLYNFFVGWKLSSALIRKMLGFDSRRELPKISHLVFRRWHKQNLSRLNARISGNRSLVLFMDEFTRYTDVQTGIHTILLLHSLGYKIHIPELVSSGRALISKGMLKKAGKLAIKNLLSLEGRLNAKMPMVGIEPSAILGFRDEFPDLVKGELKETAQKIAQHTFTLEEFLWAELQAGHINTDLFSDESQTVYFHGHCHQKSLSSMDATMGILSMAPNKTVVPIECGCCGMAGSFGYEKDHYDISMAIGELSLFPAVRKAPLTALISASGTSCRQQIMDGTGRKAYHPADILYQWLKEKPESGP